MYNIAYLVVLTAPHDYGAIADRITKYRFGMIGIQMATLISSVNPQVEIIGISGASRSGKSQLANMLYKTIKSDNSHLVMKIGQDRYFLGYMEYHKMWPDPMENWDDPSAINWDRFYSDIIKMRDELIKNSNYSIERGILITKCFLIVEGFMCFYEKRLRDLFDHKIWLEIDQPICYTRRMATFPVTEDYFHCNLWPNYISYRALLFDELKIPLSIIDGQKSREVVYQEVEKIIEINKL